MFLGENYEHRRILAMDSRQRTMNVVKIQQSALTNKPVDATIELNKATKSIETVVKIFKILFHVVLCAGTI